MLDPDVVRQRLVRRFAAQRAEWLAGGGDWPLRIALGVPTERDAARVPELVRAWIEAWSRWSGRGRVEWVLRAWPAFGEQRLPAAVVFDSAESVATAVGESSTWTVLSRRLAVLAEEWPALGGTLQRHFDALATWPDVEFGRVCDTLRWLVSHPDSGHYIRQIPVLGVDSKWIEAHQVLLRDCLACIRGMDGSQDLHALAGLRRPPTLLRMRILDPALRARLGGLGDIQAPVDQLAALVLPVKRVILVENLQSGLALGDMSGTVALMRQGYAVDQFGHLPWLRATACLYWGDIDTHGLAILDRVRAHLPVVRSVLMDVQTLLDHRELWSEEPQPARAGEYPRLTPTEQALMRDLLGDRWGPRVRLEQERIPWAGVLTRLREEMGG